MIQVKNSMAPRRLSLGSRPQFGGTVMTAFLLHNQNEELPANTQVDEAESRDFEGQGK